MMKTLLIANRSEIAIRIARTAKEMGMKTVGIFTEPDRKALHTRLLDQVFEVDSYLNGPAIVKVAQEVGADGIHPGYGFLSENGEFARQVGAAGIKFVGPTPSVIDAMGDKLLAKETMRKAGVPVVPSWSGPLDQAEVGGAEVGFPLLVKAAAGGGGKGMRLVHSPEELPQAIKSAAGEAAKAFGDDRVFLERYIERPRHVEFQIFGDEHGNVVHLGERECSIQRRYQKIVEESPCLALDEALRAKMGQAAVAAAEALGYTNAGTVEFILGQDRHFYFLEVNTRLQVEHPVTELLVGKDLVRLQLEVAQGALLGFEQEQVQGRGHAIELRLYAEDPDNNFMPSIGTLRAYKPPHGPGLRLDSGVEEGSEVGIHFDPMLAKLVIWGQDREAARTRALRALRRFVVLGVTTNLPFLARILEHPEFVSGNTHTHFLQDQTLDDSRRQDLEKIATLLAAASKTPTQQSVTAAVTQTPWTELGGWRQYP